MKRKQARRWLELCFVLLGFVSVAWFARRVAWSEAILVVLHIGIFWTLLYLAINGVLVAMMAGRWWLILRRQGVLLSYTAAIIYRHIAATVSVLTPGPQFGGEPVQVYLLRRRSAATLPTAVASVALDKTVELVANFSFLVAGASVFLVQGVFHTEMSSWALAVPIGLLALPLALLAALRQGLRPLSSAVERVARFVLPQHRHEQTVTPIIEPLRASEDEMHLLLRRQPATIAASLLISLLTWLALFAEFWLATWLVGLSFGWLEVLTLLLAARLAILLPVPAGLGVLEASQIGVVQFLGADVTGAVALVLLMRLRDLLLVVLGLIFAAREGGLTRLRQRADVPLIPHKSQPYPAPTVSSLPLLQPVEPDYPSTTERNANP